MNPTTKAAVIEALTLAANRMDRAALDYPIGSAGRSEMTEWANEARAALRSEPPLPIKGITRDDTVHGEEYFTRAQVEAMLREPEPTPEPGEREALSPQFLEGVRELADTLMSGKAGLRDMRTAALWLQDFYLSARASLPPAPTKGTPASLR